MAAAPARYPPPWRVGEALGVPTDADPIEVGILIVGAGPAGLACAIRLGQLLADDPETARRLGDVPVAVVEKGKQPGSHLLAGVTVLAEGTQGHLTGAAIERFGLHGASPQVWALGVKEVWKVAKP